MIRVLLFLCSCALAFADNNSSIFSLSASPSPTVNVSTHSMTITTTSVVPPINTTSAMHPNVTVSPHPMTTSVVPMTTSVGPTTPSKPTTPKPTTPKPTYKYGQYNVKSGGVNGTYCLLAQMDVKMDVPYESESGPNTTTDKTSIHVPYPRNHPDVSVTGLCENTTSKLVIMWNSTRLEFEFKRNSHSGNSSNLINAEDKSKSWEVEELSLFINTKNNSKFHNPQRNISVSSKNIGLKVGEGYTSYRCNADIKYNISGVMVHLSNVKLQPFDVKNSEYSSSTQDCPEDSHPTKKPDNNIVPIAVGCALAGLVLIVLIAYIIGRRKSQRGYEKV